MRSISKARYVLALALCLGAQNRSVSQHLQVLDCAFEGSFLTLEYQILDIPSYTESKFKYALRTTDQSVYTTITPESGRMTWVVSNKKLTARFEVPTNLRGRHSNLELKIEAEDHRVHASAVGSNIALAGITLLARAQSSDRYDQYLIAPIQTDADRLINSAQKWHRTSLITGLLSLGGLGTYWKLHQNIRQRNWSISPTSILIHPDANNEFFQVNSLSSPCVFSAHGNLPKANSTLRISAAETCHRCRDLGITVNTWMGPLSCQFDIVSREELTETVFREHQDIWANGLASGDWDLRLGEVSAAEYSALIECRCGPQTQVALQIIDNVTTKVVWSAIGNSCPSNRFLQEVELMLQNPAP